ncbi:MAG: hypothetical protein KY469_18830 [Actinobacteria bacterium]|nr:hypothetical protein [Actinomycetota bacterium]
MSLDPDKGTKDGSPVDDLPDHIRLLDIQLPDDGKAMRPDWSPDGERLILLDAPIGDVWEHDLAAGTTRNLTGSLLPAGVIRAHHLSNGDLVLCALTERSPGEPESDRFNGQLFVVQRPLGTRAPVPLGEPCWEGIAVSKDPTSTRIAWNRSTIDFTAVPEVFVEALIGESQVLTGTVVYDADGTPSLVDVAVVLDKTDVSPDTPAVEAQDFRPLDDGDPDPDDELIFTAYFHKGGQAMGIDLDTGEITDYAFDSPYYEEAEGTDPGGAYVMVERDLTITLFPGMVDIWRLPLDGSGAFERMTTFDHYEGFGANQPVISPDGTRMAFGLKVEGEEGESDGILIMDLVAFDDLPEPEPEGPDSAPPPVDEDDAVGELAATGSTPAIPALLVLGLAGLLATSRRRRSSRAPIDP